MTDAATRRDGFFAKADLPCADGVLRRLRETAAAEARARTPQIERAAGELLGRRVAAQPGARQGTFHLIHFLTAHPQAPGPPCVARSGRPQVLDPDDTLRAQRLLAPHLRAAGVPIAAPCADAVGAQRIGAFDLAIEEAVPGTPLAELPQAAQDAPQTLRAIGGALARLHGIAAAGAGPIDYRAATGAPRGLHGDWRAYMTLRLDAHLAACRAAGALDAEQADAAQRLLASCATCAAAMDEAPMRLLHGDLGNHNLLLGAGRLRALIDWEDALAGDPAFDVAMWMTFHPPRRHAAFLDGYGAVGGAFRLRIGLSYLRIALAKTVHRARFGYADLPGREPAARRIDRGLALVREALGVQ